MLMSDVNISRLNLSEDFFFYEKENRPAVMRGGFGITFSFLLFLLFSLLPLFCLVS